MNLTKRQKEILDFIRSYRREQGISPTQREIRERFGLSSFGTVQKHLKRLEEKGALSREWNRSRGIAPSEPAGSRAVALLGLVAAGRPIEPFPDEEAIEVPPSLLGKGEHFVLRVRGDSMIEDGIRDGDFVIVARRSQAQNGQTVVALVRGEATLKRYYGDGPRVRLQPANASMKALTYDAHDVTVQGVVTGLMRSYSVPAGPAAPAARAARPAARTR
ncbi:MAG TPA: transcriptional repressor LexA [Thermoanaerobaculia bacterium]|nr:transcriptional repressor LexA [Thermoanaerobaculia bacterium]